MTAARQLLPYLDAMLRENTRLNLTSIRDPEQARVLHIQDSLAIGALGLSPTRALDLGSGNGFPGVALLALYPDAEVFLLERTAKKVAAIQRILDTDAVKASGLCRPRLLHMDAVQAPALLKDLLGTFDLVTARALASPEQAAQWARPFLRVGGSLVLWMAAGGRPLPPAALPGFVRREVHDYTLPEPAPRSRCLVHYLRT